MALQQDTTGTFGETIHGVYWVPGEFRIAPAEGSITAVAHGFQNKDAWNMVKTARALKAKQEVEQAAWRERRTIWEAEHAPDEPFEEPEPFEEIPLMPAFIQSAPVTVPLAVYLEMEASLKGGACNLWGFIYEVLSDPQLSNQFENATNV